MKVERILRSSSIWAHNLFSFGNAEVLVMHPDVVAKGESINTEKERENRRIREK